MKFNIKVWVLTCLLIVLCGVSFADYTHYNYASLGDPSGQLNGWMYQQFTANGDLINNIKIIIKVTGNTGGTLYLYLINDSGSNTLSSLSTNRTLGNINMSLLTTSYTEQNLTFSDKSLINGQKYWIAIKSEGSTQSWQWQYSGYAGCGLQQDAGGGTYGGGYRNACYPANFSYKLLNPITINSQTISSTYWNTPKINLTWNVSNAQNGTMTLYRNGIINQTIFYQPIKVNLTQITNTFLIGDNISYNLFLQNGTNNLSQNSSTIQISPPTTNYINILNTSTLYKQNLICNYSIENSDNIIIDWLVNNNLFKSNSLYFNITDYNNSNLNNNLTCRVNSTVLSQSYVSYNNSDNIIIVGQNITFYAKINHSNSVINDFSICYSVGCYNTTTGDLTIWNYNISDTYTFYNSIYETKNVTLTTNIKNQSYTFYVWDAQSINFTFYNQNFIKLSNVLIQQYSINYNISYNYSTNNGNLYVYLISPTKYNIISSSSGYHSSSIFLEVNQNSYQNKDIFLINSTQATLVGYTVIFSDGQYASNYDIKLQKHDASTQTWKYIQECRTNDVGICYMYVVEPDFYRYAIFDSRGFNVLTTDNEFVVYATRDPFIIPITNQYFSKSQYCSYLKSRNSPVKYAYINSNYTYNFSLGANWNIGDINPICMKLTKNTKYTYYTTEQEIFKDCLYYSSTSQIYENNVELSKDLYSFVVYANVSGMYCSINQGSLDLRGNTNDTTNLLFVFIGLVFSICVGIFLKSIDLTMILSIVWIALCSLIGWLAFSYGTIFGLAFIVIYIIILFTKG